MSLPSPSMRKSGFGLPMIRRPLRQAPVASEKAVKNTESIHMANAGVKPKCGEALIASLTEAF